MDLDLRQLLQIARRRWWIVALLMIVAGASAYISSSRETPMYSATATMVINPGLSTSTNDYNAVLTSQRLATTYQEMVTTKPMHDRVEQAIDEPLVTGFSASASENSQIIRVTASGPDPAQAALVANTVVEQFQEYMQARSEERASSNRSSLDDQIAALEQRQQEIDAQIADLRAGDNADDSVTQSQIEDLSSERSSISQTLLDLNTQAITIDTQMSASSAQIEMLDPAVEPGAPYSPQPMRSLLLGLFVGALLGAGLVALLEFLDNTVKPEVNIQGLAGAPLLATVSQLQNITPGGRQVYTMSQPKSSAAEAMRLLRTNLEFASASQKVRALTISSPSPGEGKSTTAANLGVVMAQSGMTVAIIDADLRRPTQHNIFGVENTTGLTTLLTHPDQAWDAVARKVALPGLLLIPSGPVPPNPSDLLSSDGFVRLLETIKNDVDLVIIDSSPVLSASDSLIVSRHADGVMLICHSGKTRLDALRQATHAIHQGGIRLVGVVLNRQKGQHGASYYGEYYGPVSSPAPSAGD